MTNWTRTAAVAMAATALISVAACGSDAGDESDNTPDTSRPDTISDEQVDAAEADGKVIVYSNAPEDMWAALLPRFEELFPGVTVETVDIGGPELVQRYLSEKRAGAETADLIIDSAASTWLELRDAGEILDRQSSSEEGLPDFAKVGGGIYSVAADPSVIIYNSALLDEDARPESLSDIASLTEEHAGKLTTYAIENGLGYSEFWTLAHEQGDEAMDKLAAVLPSSKVENSGGTMIQKIAQGEYVAGYMQSGAARLLLEDMGGADLLGWSYQSDGTVAVPRFSGVTVEGAHPDAAALLQDYLLSAAGQSVMCDSGLSAVRDDVADQCGDFSLADARDAVGEENLYIAPLDDALRTEQQEFSTEFEALRTR